MTLTLCVIAKPQNQYVRPSEVFIKTDRRNLKGSELVLHPPIVHGNTVANHPRRIWTCDLPVTALARELLTQRDAEFSFSLAGC